MHKIAELTVTLKSAIEGIPIWTDQDGVGLRIGLAKEGYTLNSLGIAYRLLNLYEKAIEFYEQALVALAFLYPDRKTH